MGHEGLGGAEIDFEAEQRDAANQPEPVEHGAGGNFQLEEGNSHGFYERVRETSSF